MLWYIYALSLQQFHIYSIIYYYGAENQIWLWCTSFSQT